MIFTGRVDAFTSFRIYMYKVMLFTSQQALYTEMGRTAYQSQRKYAMDALIAALGNQVGLPYTYGTLVTQCLPNAKRVDAPSLKGAVHLYKLRSLIQTTWTMNELIDGVHRW